MALLLAFQLQKFQCNILKLTDGRVFKSIGPSGRRNTVRVSLCGMPCCGICVHMCHSWSQPWSPISSIVPHALSLYVIVRLLPLRLAPVRPSPNCSRSYRLETIRRGRQRQDSYLLQLPNKSGYSIHNAKKRYNV